MCLLKVSTIATAASFFRGSSCLDASYGAVRNHQLKPIGPVPNDKKYW